MLRNLLRLSRPIHLLLAALAYSFGIGLADYLGKPFLADAFWLGLVAALLAQVSMNLLGEIFRPPNEPLSEGETLRERLMLRNAALYTAIASLTAVVVIAFILYSSRRLTIESIFFLLLSLVVILLYAIPPVRLINRGFGGFLRAVHLAYIFPSLGYILQAGETHQLLFLTVPIFFLAFGYFIVMDFPSFAADQKYERVTFLTRLGWERVIPLHHLFVLLAYVLFLASPILNVSLSLLWPAFLTLPFALFQIFQLRNISFGAPPNWILLTVTALSVFGLTLYFLTLTFLLR